LVPRAGAGPAGCHARQRGWVDGEPSPGSAGAGDEVRQRRAPPSAPMLCV